MISVLILTFNEELNLPACLESLKWSDDIVLLDSYSTDRTVEIAQTAGARVIQRKFDNWAAHQNWANEHIEFKYPWVYYSDADEIVTPELRDELLAVAQDSDRENVAYRLRFKNMFMEKWIKRSSLYPTFVMRFFQPKRVRWEREVNPVPIVDGSVGLLAHHFEHHSFNKGLSAWFDKHNRYSDGEAREALKILGNGKIDWKGLFMINQPSRHRKSLKALSWHFPCRSEFVFFYLYFVRMGFLDGIAGWRYCRMRAMYEYMIDLKIIEHRRREKGLPI